MTDETGGEGTEWVKDDGWRDAEAEKKDKHSE